MIDVPRDRFNRPLIVPPDGGKPVAYTRVTTLAGTLEDHFNIGLWEKRMVAIGLADRPDLLLAVSAHREDKKALNNLTDQAKEAAAASASANRGTALHLLSEKIDRGEKLPALPAEFVADLEAYRRTTAGLTVRAIEQFVVHDALRVGGTADRVYEIDGVRYIGDTKTGSSIELGINKIAMQLATYSRSVAYDPETAERTPLNVDQQWGIVIHLPAGKGDCKPYWINLEHGWYGVQLASAVREFRKNKINHVAHSIDAMELAA